MGKFNEKPIVTYRSNIGEDSHDNYIKGRNVRLKMSAEQRARESTGWFKFVYQGFREHAPDQETIDKAIEIATEYYRQNPYRIWVDINVWKDIIGGADACMKSVLNIIVTTMTQDMKDAEKNRIFEESKQRNLLGEEVTT